MTLEVSKDLDEASYSEFLPGETSMASVANIGLFESYGSPGEKTGQRRFNNDAGCSQTPDCVEPIAPSNACPDSGSPQLGG